MPGTATDRWRNWAGNQRADGIEVVRPHPADEVAAGARRRRGRGPAGAADRQRPLLHRRSACPRTSSWSATGSPASGRVGADGPGDRAAPGRRCTGSTPSWPRAGWALTNLGDIDRQTVAGALVDRHARHGRAVRRPGDPGARPGAGDAGRRRCCACSPTEHPDVFAAGPGRARVRWASSPTVTLQAEPAFALRAVEGPGTLPRADRGLRGADDLDRPRRVLLVPAHRRDA